MTFYMNAAGIQCALGCDLKEVRANLFARQEPCGVAPTEQYTPGRKLHLGCLPDRAQPSIVVVPSKLRSRNNALAAAALRQIRPQVDGAIASFGPGRVAVVVGTSTAGLAEGELAARQYAEREDFPETYDYAQQEMGNVAAFITGQLGLRGPAYVISTACSSGAKSLVSAARLLRAGVADAVVAGAVDTLSAFTIAGFSALDSVSEARCNPLSANRCGINLGEGAALFLMSREPGPLRLAGWGETSDAHHMSAPDPSGRAAMDAMRQALRRADVDARMVDYLNLHGTATPHNDAVESLAVAEVFGPKIPVSSTKPLTGHALAAAGAVEAVLAWLTLSDNARGYLPPHWWDGVQDPALPRMRVVEPGESLGRTPKYVLSNSFAFGGSNAALLFAAG